jgi:hypothetical protein
MMTQIVVDSRLREELQAAGDAVEFVDESGCVFGFFSPIPKPPYDPSWIPEQTDAEYKHRLSQPGKYSTEEVLKHLANL